MPSNPDKGESARATHPPRSPTASAASPRGIVAAAATTGGGGAGGPPAGAVIAVAAVAFLGLAGWLRIRGRSGSHAPEARREGRQEEEGKRKWEWSERGERHRR